MCLFTVFVSRKFALAKERKIHICSLTRKQNVHRSCMAHEFYNFLMDNEQENWSSQKQDTKPLVFYDENTREHKKRESEWIEHKY